ncbi:hypothetical protein [Pseudomonas juntendi]|uniref:hypothetical protein n=1 Tax=Pseudomonas juntendi TaxID=2666183 RepID=UPI00244B25C2|nr:hypothetical protein [Pseudomonas juntendi]MDH0042429.1 hypothetical protein [Pseudomonas juntendi]
MFNQTAQTVFDESIERALASPPGELVAASETELSYVAGMTAYALARGDITVEQRDLITMRIDMARYRLLAQTLRTQRLALAARP